MRLLKWLFSRAYLMLFLATLMWAGNAVAGKLAVGHISPFLFTSLRWLVASLVVLPFAYKFLRKDWHQVRANLVFLFFIAALGFTGFNNLMYKALQTTSAMNAAIIQAAMPASIFALNFIIFRTIASKTQLWGFPITVVGVIIVVTQGQWQLLSKLSFVVGDLLMLLASCCYGLYTVLLGRKPAIHCLSLIAVLSVSALFSSLPMVVFESYSEQLVLPDQTAWLLVLYTAICASLLAQVFWIKGVEIIGSNASSLFINLVPIMGSILAIVLLGETPYWHHMLGLVLIIGGISLAQR